MNRFIFLIFFFSLLVLQSSCVSENKESKEPELTERESLYKEVIEIHDAVMPKMSDINRVKRKLQDLFEANSSKDDRVKTKLNFAIDELIAAENSMMDWMKAFKAPKKADPDEQVINYLKEEKLKISRVSDQMLTSLDNGTQLMEALEKGQYQTSNE